MTVIHGCRESGEYYRDKKTSKTNDESYEKSISPVKVRAAFIYSLQYMHRGKAGRWEMKE